MLRSLQFHSKSKMSYSDGQPVTSPLLSSVFLLCSCEGAFRLLKHDNLLLVPPATFRSGFKSKRSSPLVEIWKDLNAIFISNKAIMEHNLSKDVKLSSTKDL